MEKRVKEINREVRHMNYRIEKDTRGDVKVTISKYWGAQTESSKENYPIGNEKMPI